MQREVFGQYSNNQHLVCCKKIVLQPDYATTKVIEFEGVLLFETYSYKMKLLSWISIKLVSCISLIDSMINGSFNHYFDQTLHFDYLNLNWLPQIYNTVFVLTSMSFIVKIIMCTVDQCIFTCKSLVSDAAHMTLCWL